LNKIDDDGTKLIEPQLTKMGNTLFNTLFTSHNSKFENYGNSPSFWSGDPGLNISSNDLQIGDLIINPKEALLYFKKGSKTLGRSVKPYRKSIVECITNLDEVLAQIDDGTNELLKKCAKQFKEVRTLKGFPNQETAFKKSEVLMYGQSFGFDSCYTCNKFMSLCEFNLPSGSYLYITDVTGYDGNVTIYSVNDLTIKK